MFNTSFIDSVSRTDTLPPLHLSRKVKKSDKWKKAVMDAFENIALKQLHENLSFFDNYRVVSSKMTYQELSEVLPHLNGLQDLLDGVGIPSQLKHHDITSILVNTIVDKYVDFQDKFHVTDIGEIAENEFLRYKNEEITKLLEEVTKNIIDQELAKNGLTPEGKQFSSEEEQQAFMQQLEEQKKKFTPVELSKSTKNSFKTIGTRWAEGTLDHDKERFDLLKLGKESLKEYLTAGRAFREYKIYHDKYFPRNWSAKNTFFSKEVEVQNIQKGEYAGRIQPYTPSECIQEFGHKIPTDKQKELLGGNTTWENYVSNNYASGTIEEAVNSNFNQIVTTPFKGYSDYNFMLGLQDQLEIPMGIETRFNKDGTQTVRERFLPRYYNGQNGLYSSLAVLLRDDFQHRKDLCQVTEVYFRAYDLWGYLTYENEYGRIVTEEVTEDILKDFLKEKGIKQSYKESIHDIITSFEVNTLKWQLRPVTYYGVKIQSANLQDALYIDVEPMEHQIKGDSEYDTLLPVAGIVGESIVTKIAPFQAKYNLCMNQITNLIEKELGMILLLSTDLIPSEYDGWGNAEEALIALRNTAKNVGIMPGNTSLDSQKQSNNSSGVQLLNVTHGAEIQSRVQLADFFQKKAYELIGINPILNQPTKYETAEGVRNSAETNVAQISGIHTDFSYFNKGALELHLAVAQYCQSNKKDLSIFYTKSDASIQYLKIQDPNLPLRRFGLIATFDSQKRKELELLKQAIMQQNTLGADTMELARLIGSDSYSEIIEIARIERERREGQQQAEYQQQQQLVQQKAQADDENASKAWERQEQSKDKDRANRLEVERIQALGRAADKQADPNSFEQINREADNALKERDLNLRYEQSAQDFRLKEKQSEDQRMIKIKELELKAKELEERTKARQSKEYVATINKN